MDIIFDIIRIFCLHTGDMIVNPLNGTVVEVYTAKGIRTEGEELDQLTYVFGREYSATGDRNVEFIAPSELTVMMY